jgi:hypothetical protein
MAISQKLHTKLVQKLILTPSLQQAIKLLPMSPWSWRISSTRDGGKLLLEEVPTEELQPPRAGPEREGPRKPTPKRGPWTTPITSIFGDYLDDGTDRRRRSQGAPADREHAVGRTSPTT